MSHSSGIPVSQKLKETFGSALKDRSVRIIKVQIQNDELYPVETVPPSGKNDWKDDLELVPSLLDPTTPSYLLFRTDDTNTHGDIWLLLCYVPDKSKVKDKMTYAASRSNLKLGLGDYFFSQEIFGTIAGDLNKAGYHAHVLHQAQEAPLTAGERHLQEERVSAVYMGSTGGYVHGVSFPVAPEARQKLEQLKNGGLNYVQLGIDVDGEKIILTDSKSLPISGFPALIDGLDEPRFHYFRYDHEFEGQTVKSVVFIFSCPDGSNGSARASVKHRMLYASSKANVEGIFTGIGGTIDKKLEVNSGSEVEEDPLNRELHPEKEEKKAAFARPAKPGKGGRRLVSPKKGTDA